MVELSVSSTTWIHVEGVESAHSRYHTVELEPSAQTMNSWGFVESANVTVAAVVPAPTSVTVKPVFVIATLIAYCDPLFWTCVRYSVVPAIT